MEETIDLRAELRPIANRLAAQRNARLRQLVTLGIIRAVELRVRAVKERSDKHREETDVTPARRNNGEVSVLLFNKLAGGVWPVV